VGRTVARGVAGVTGRPHVVSFLEVSGDPRDIASGATLFEPDEAAAARSGGVDGSSGPRRRLDRTPPTLSCEVRTMFDTAPSDHRNEVAARQGCAWRQPLIPNQPIGNPLP
jgi:hypothetical protein